MGADYRTVTTEEDNHDSTINVTPSHKPLATPATPLTPSATPPATPMAALDAEGQPLFNPFHDPEFRLSRAAITNNSISSNNKEKEGILGSIDLTSSNHPITENPDEVDEVDGVTSAAPLKLQGIEETEEKERNPDEDTSSV